MTGGDHDPAGNYQEDRRTDKVKESVTPQVAERRKSKDRHREKSYHGTVPYHNPAARTIVRSCARL